jgi:hypothetical protein
VSTPCGTPASPPDPLADELESALRTLLADFPEAQPPRPRPPGRPPVIPAAMLWLGFLLCVLRGFAAQRALWRLLAFHGFWGHPPQVVTEQAIYDRLARAPVTALAEVFARVTALVRARGATVNDLPYARFATEVVALDHCTLDALLRKLELLRELPRGDPALLPGRLATLFDLRRQLFYRVDLETDAQRNVKWEVDRLLEGLPPGTLVLFDLGYFAFRWFDLLTQRSLYFVSRLREKTSWVVVQVLYEGTVAGVTLRESLVYLGAYRADRAGEPVRLIELTRGDRTWRYVTNVLDPPLLPAAHVVALYARRWDIEQSFNLLKTHLKLYLLWSGHANVVGLQVYATLIIAQVVLAFRNDLAQRTGAELREISLPLLLECLPQLVANGRDPLHELTLHGRRMKIIRPFRGREYGVPEPPPEAYARVERPPPRPARYAGKDGGPGRPPRPPGEKPARRRSTGWGMRAGRAPRR